MELNSNNSLTNIFLSKVWQARNLFMKTLMRTARAAPSIWATIKREMLEKGAFDSLEDAKTELFDRGGGPLH